MNILSIESLLSIEPNWFDIVDSELEEIEDNLEELLPSDSEVK